MLVPTIQILQAMEYANLAITVGDDVSLAVTLLQSDGVTPINLTGYSLKTQINFSNPPGMTLLNTSNGGIVITNAAQGMFEVLMSTSFTANLVAGEYPYDLWWTNPSGAENKIFSGLFIVEQNVTPVP